MQSAGKLCFSGAFGGMATLLCMAALYGVRQSEADSSMEGCNPTYPYGKANQLAPLPSPPREPEHNKTRGKKGK